MTEEKLVVTVEPPSKKAIAKATILALLIAAVLLITVVLPAEYGIDPLGTGKALRLTDLSKAAQPKVPEKAAEAPAMRTGEASPTIVPVLAASTDGSAPAMKGT